MPPHYNRTFECPLDPAEQGPEFELVLTCCRPKPSKAHFLRQQELAATGRLDTRKVLELGIRHKISPLLYCNLRSHPAGTFSNELLDKLAAQHKRNTQRALQALQATHELMRTQDLHLIVMKGLDVASRAYGDLAARHVGDIDILVDPEQLNTALDKLAALGWHLAQPEILLAANRNILLQSHQDCTLTRKGFPQMELHWRAMHNPFEFPIDDWRTLSVSKKSNIGIPGLNNEDLIIYLCLHGAKHGWGRLKWLFDLPNILDTHHLNWPQLWQRANRLDAGLAIQQGLLLAQKYCGIDLSPEIKSGFRFSVGPSKWKAICTFQQGPELWMEYPPARLKMYKWIIRIQTVRRADVLLWYCAMIFYPNIDDYRLLKLPSWLHILYFPLRPILWGIRQIQIRKMRRLKTMNVDN